MYYQICFSRNVGNSIKCKKNMTPPPPPPKPPPHLRYFDFIECFTTTFLRAHSWLNWVDEDDDEDEVGLKEKPEDTRYIKKITSK